MLIKLPELFILSHVHSRFLTDLYRKIFHDLCSWFAAIVIGSDEIIAFQHFFQCHYPGLGIILAAFLKKAPRLATAYLRLIK